MKIYLFLIPINNNFSAIEQPSKDIHWPLRQENIGGKHTEIGKCLYHAPRRTEGLFLDGTVAKFLDEHENARIGYDMGSVNARGAYFINPTGGNEIAIAGDLDEQANQMEEAGFFNFAATLRHMAQDHRLEAEVEREKGN